MEDATQHDAALGVGAQLEAAGFRDAEVIGHGGFGIVYRCVEAGLGRTVAVKLLLEDLAADEDRERFVREQQAMARLSGHPNILDVHQAGVTASGQPFIVMPYCANGALDSRLRAQGTLSDREVLAIGVKLAGALETAHQAGILHRDVKPANILINDFGEPQLTDFGIAHIKGGFETATGVITGSPAYTAPEVLTGRTPTAKSDLYSLGAVLFCLATGHAVFERKEGEKVIAQFVRIVNEPVPNPRDRGVSEALSSAIEHVMNPDPAARPASAAEFGEELRAAEATLGLAPTDMAIPAGTQISHADTSTTRRSSLTPPVAGSKYRPPAAAHALVERARLIEMLRAGGRRRLALIHAPAGFGKSTLAAQWRTELVSDDVAVAWLSVDADDNNVVWFVSHVLDAIRNVRPGVGYGMVELLESGGARAVRSVLNVLLNEIHETGTDLVLVVDDWHRIEDPQTIAAMAMILDDGCHHLRVIVSSRSHGGLPLGRLRVRDELIEIDSEALRFDETESRAFLTERGVDENDVADLLQSTEGWIAALQLASLSHRMPAGITRRLGADHQALEEYLVENVLDSLNPDLLDRMLAIAVTERTCGDLAARLTGAGNGQTVLDEIEHRELFLSRTDDDWEWMRFQNMFREYLVRRLHTRDPQREIQLHKLASLWFADNGLLKEAVDHALAAGDTERAADLVEEHREGFLARSATASLVGLVAKLPAQVVEQRPSLQTVNSLLEDSQRTLNRVLHEVGATVGLGDLIPEVDVVHTASKGWAKGVGSLKGLMHGLSRSTEPKKADSD
ncbi:serine/threonine-protein kinase [Smaragdicoccus niigatensis]|uniref:serine/threonine-protein kinase n=1 Tax=Smaragdicoccus niigatensis TaxID=359359 RepID=UPI000382A353|nr:serine/threonine-protein kinase [Smaragdicoccus niigatensis]